MLFYPKNPTNGNNLRVTIDYCLLEFQPRSFSPSKNFVANQLPKPNTPQIWTAAWWEEEKRGNTLNQRRWLLQHVVESSPLFDIPDGFQGQCCRISCFGVFRGCDLFSTRTTTVHCNCNVFRHPEGFHDTGKSHSLAFGVMLECSNCSWPRKRVPWHLPEVMGFRHGAVDASSQFDPWIFRKLRVPPP